MAATTPRDRRASQQRVDLVRARTRSEPASVTLLDPLLDDQDPLVVQLRGMGVHADVHRDHLTALVRMGSHTPDVVVVSAAIRAPELPRLVEVLRAELTVPVLLAYCPEEIDRIGPTVAAGAIPVVSRPYRLHELLVALAAHRPRRRAAARRRAVGGLTLDADGYEAHLGGVRVDVTRGEFELLALLAEAADHVVLREELTDRLWPASPDPAAVLIATVARVRRKLAAVGAPHAIRTVRGVGYRLEVAGLRPTLPTASPPRD